MYSNTIEEQKKVVLFNHYIKAIEENEKPDIIIIGMPGVYIPINENITNHFGILAYEICQAVNPDFSICSLFLKIISRKL